MTRVFYASTLFGAMGLVAAIDAGMFGDRAERRVLIASTNTAAPEISDSFVDSDAFVALGQRFDEIVRWNDFIAPLHPAAWQPPASEIPLMQRLLREHLSISDGISELVLESIAVPPSRTIGALIDDCPITVYSDGLMSYGPTRSDLPVEIGHRTTRLLYLDLLPGVRPLLLRESGVAVEAIPDSAFAKIVAELPTPIIDDAVGCPMILGQYLSQLGVLSVEEELGLHDRMLAALAAGGHRHVVFKPHPAAGRSHVRPLEITAARLGVTLTVARDSLPAEAWFAAAQPALVVSCFSTALLTASRYFGIPVATTGGAVVLERITPYENSNRIPATIVDATIPELGADGTLVAPPERDLNQLLSAVGYCMQASRNPDLRESAASYVSAHGRGRYFKKKRLDSLGLLAPSAVRGATVRHMTRRLKRRTYVFATRSVETWRKRRIASAAAKRS